jgi:hypothetical protein
MGMFSPQLALTFVLSLMLHAPPARAADESETELAKKTQNPVAPPRDTDRRISCKSST